MSPAQTRTLWRSSLKCWRSLVPLRSKPPYFFLSEDADALYPWLPSALPACQESMLTVIFGTPPSQRSRYGPVFIF